MTSWLLLLTFVGLVHSQASTNFTACESFRSASVAQCSYCTYCDACSEGICGVGFSQSPVGACSDYSCDDCTAQCECTQATASCGAYQKYNDCQSECNLPGNSGCDVCQTELTANLSPLVAANFECYEQCVGMLTTSSIATSSACAAPTPLSLPRSSCQSRVRERCSAGGLRTVSKSSGYLTNGCGPLDGTQLAAIINVAAPYLYTCCEHHDECFSECGSFTYEQCNDALYKCAYEVCDHGNIYKLLGCNNAACELKAWALSGLCKGEIKIGELYINGDEGCRAYQDSQTQLCECECAM